VETWSFNSSAPLNAERLQDWLSMLYSLRPFAMLRLKGILQLIDQEQPVLLQAVGSSFSPPELLDAWPGGLEETNLVLIFRDISSTDIEISFKQHVLK
jgi:G3E family GTPase